MGVKIKIIVPNNCDNEIKNLHWLNQPVIICNVNPKWTFQYLYLKHALFDIIQYVIMDIPDQYEPEAFTLLVKFW